MNLYLNHKRIKVTPKQSVGKGGEADVYDIGEGRALKIFKGADHPDFAGMPEAQRAAAERLAVHQHKLPAFPRYLPPNVVVPHELATDGKGGRIVGYAMSLVAGADLLTRLAEAPYRRAGYTNEAVCAVFGRLHETVTALHRCGVVVGDFNDLNVLVRGDRVYLIDADSFQFGSFQCPVFSVKFVDPLLCDPTRPALELCKPHTSDSDWYAFAVMLMQSLLLAGPYDGVFKPSNSARRIAHDARWRQRITVFDPEVKYPRAARPVEGLPDELAHFFFDTFVRDRRGPFPSELIAGIQWTVCGSCGIEHARSQCPRCTIGPVAIPPRARENVTAEVIFETSGHIVAFSVVGGTPAYAFVENGLLLREGRRPVATVGGGFNAPVYVTGGETVISRDTYFEVVADAGQFSQSHLADRGLLPGTGLAANTTARYWLQSGRLVRTGPYGPIQLGEALEGQTAIWVGEGFGFGVYRAGRLSVAFIFDRERPGLLDSVRVPRLSGQIVSATSVFSPERCWFFCREAVNGVMRDHCTVVRRDGFVEASLVETGDVNPLFLNPSGACTAGAYLLVPTDDGIVQFGVSHGAIVQTKSFPVTEPFVTAQSRLVAGADGLYVVDFQRIVRLTLTA